MNIQQLRYVVAIANSGTFREASEKMFVSQPSLSISVKELENELGFKIFNRTSSGTVLTRRGMEFYEKALGLVKKFDSFEHQYVQQDEKNDEFSISSQHYDFLPPLITEFSQVCDSPYKLRIFESTTIQILDEVSQGYSELGIIYVNDRNIKGLKQNMHKLGLEYVEMIEFQTHIYLRKGHPLACKSTLELSDLSDLPTVRFTQEKEEYLYYSENFFDTSDATQTFNVTDRATLNGILERTDAYATGSGFLDSHSVHGITVIPVKDGQKNKMVYVKRQGVSLSKVATQFIDVMQTYFDKRDKA